MDNNESEEALVNSTKTDESLIQNTPKKLTRRELLKKAALITGAGLAGGVTISSLVDTEGLEELAFTKDLTSEVPPILQNVEIPIKNEQLRQPQKIVKEALDIYNDWRENNPQLKRLHWSKPDNFLDYSKITGNFLQATKSKPTDFYSNLYTSVFSNDKRNNKFTLFSASGADSYRGIIKSNPGSGIIRKNIEKYRQSRKESNEDLYDAVDEIGFQEDNPDLVNDFKSSINNAVDYIKKQGNGKPLSSSVLMAYFLHQNSGNIAESFWDTTLVLKMLARSNLDNFDLKPTRQAADLLASLFLDEFSPEISLNWLSNHIPPTTDKSSYSKDYQPINKAGVLYHAWNLISWSTCMTPEIARDLTRGYYANNTEKRREEQGKEKIKTDFKIAAAVPTIARLISPYEEKAL
jgi:hypothetical protein